METIASLAATVQLIEQTIRLVQKFYQVQEAVRAAPKTIFEIEKQLASLLLTIKHISNEPGLDTILIREQLRHIAGIMIELKNFAESMKALQRRSKTWQFLYALLKKPRDDTKLVDILTRLIDAKAELSIRIEVAHVGMTRDVALGIQKIQVQAQAQWEKHQPGLRLEGNKAGQNSTQMNGIVGFDSSSRSTTVSVAENQSAGNSRQQNFVFGGPLPFHPLRSINGLNRIEF